MTLIVSAFTPWFVMQVSDRQLTATDPYTKRVERVLVPANKAVVYDNRILFGYTGLAMLEGMPTDRWLAGILADASKDTPLRVLLERVASKAQVAVRSIPAPQNCRHLAFIGIGWGRGKISGELEPLLCTVANFDQPRCGYATSPSYEFETDISIHSRMSCGWITVGAHVSERILMETSRLFKNCTERRLGVKPLVTIFCQFIRRISAFDPTVGSDLMVAAIPKMAGDANHGVYGPSGHVFGEVGDVPPTPENASTFAYSAANSNLMVEYAPNVVFPGEFAICGFTEFIGPAARRRQIDRHAR